MRTLDQLIQEQLSLPPVLPDARKILGGIPRVIGVGLGFRTRAGRTTDEIVLRVHVKRKRPLAEIPESERIPEAFGGIPIDVTLAVGARSIQLDEAFVDEKSSRKVSTLVGGVPITDRGRDDSRGTLGCFVVQTSDRSVKLLLTNQHVIYRRRTDTGRGDLVGQPRVSCSWCCKSGVIGRAVNGINDEFVDCGIARLNDRRPAVQKLPGVGKDANGLNEDLITGVPDAVLVAGLPTAVLNGEVVRKVGLITGPTTGVVREIHFPVPIDVNEPDERTMQDQIIIRPEAGGDVLGDGSLNFALDGDSGAVLINRFNQVVGLMHKATDFTGQPANQPPWRFWGAACHIHRVLDRLGLEILVSPNANTASTPAVPTPLLPPPTPTGALVPGMGLVIHRLTDEERARGGVLDEIIAALESSQMGREILRLYDTHHVEVQHLVNHDRRVKVVWHRSSGPAFMAALLSGLSDLAQPIPKQVDGFPLELMIGRMADILRGRGSASLETTVSNHLTLVLELVAKAETIADLLTHIHQHGGDR